MELDQCAVFCDTSPILEFYNDKSLFITGGTGFVGKVLIEKLLYTCENIKNIYMLLKSKNEETIEKRFAEFLNSPIFGRIKKTNPNVLKKIVPVQGNILEINLGMSDRDIQILYSEVSVVFHVAANVSFGSSLADAINCNTRPTEKIIEIVKRMKKLQAFVYVSTAYSQCDKDFVDERIYKMDLSLKTVDYLIEEMRDQKLLEKMLIGKLPNTYTFSKALSEELIGDKCVDIPTAIVRPSIIISSLKEPEPGWIDGWSGINGFTVAFGKGFLRYWNGLPDIVPDLIPVDIVVNLLIVSAWDMHVARNTSGEKNIKVFNCCTGLQNPTTFKNFITMCMRSVKKHGLKGQFRTPAFKITRDKTLHLIILFFLQIIPAYIIDGLAWLLGKEQRMFKMHERINKYAEYLGFFTLNEFNFIDYNVKNLYNKLNEQDRKMFHFNVRDINWDSFLEQYVLGLKKNVLKET